MSLASSAAAATNPLRAIPRAPRRVARRASRALAGRPRAFLGGLFGGDKSDDAPEPANAQVASTEVKTRVTVTIARPMGITLEPVTDERKGAIITELVEGGNADKLGMLEVGDVLVSCAFPGPGSTGETVDLDDRWYETILDELGGEPDSETIALTIERVLLEDDADLLGVTADAKRYWEEKREAKLRRVRCISFRNVSFFTRRSVSTFDRVGPFQLTDR